MRIVFLIVVLLHGIIHLLGFVKGFDLKEVKALTLPISKPMGMLWLCATLLLLIYGAMHFANHKYAWVVGILAVIVSQVLIILFWKDAKFGTLANLVILLVSIVSFGHFAFKQMVQQETANLLSHSNISKEKVMTEEDLSALPVPVKKWLRNSGAIGKPYITVAKVFQRAEMKLKPDQENWYHAEAVQYSTVDVPAFIWTVDVKMNSVLRFLGRDKFEAGQGEMLIKLNALFNIVDERGEKLNEGSLQRYLGELVWLPSLALSPYITWQEVDDTTAIATMDYKGTKGSGTFYFNSDGDFIRFSAMRFSGNEVDSVRKEWVLLVDDYKTFDGIEVPSKMTATWKLDNDDWTWLKLEIMDLRYNENAQQ